MATHANVLAWRIPGTEEPDGLPSMGSHRVGHNWSDLAAVAAAGKWMKPQSLTGLQASKAKGLGFLTPHSWVSHWLQAAWGGNKLPDTSTLNPIGWRGYRSWCPALWGKLLGALETESIKPRWRAHRNYTRDLRGSGRVAPCLLWGQGRAGFMGRCPVYLHRILPSEGPHASGLIVCSHRLELLSNSTFDCIS